ncbi:uncharacterized protein EAF01_004803 [Botrytis porri]|uniref:uncharacterized protein n=1 Tax=Botrytis porri TaxID=87229 RepID=UPI00190139A3|nr:uncharacterized protein EAF01_004803 [Botrytis porri]KAF7907216.1 hypothetical protein EAF01_004803 [Botrytis porri]
MSAPSPQTLYFAYGSNLSLTQMQTRCPDSTYIGMGVLQNYRWIVNQRGYANVVFCGEFESHSHSHSQSNSQSKSQSGEDIKDGTHHHPSIKETATNLPSNTVYGLLYTLSRRDERALDINEGVPFAYTKAYLPITLLSTSPTLDTLAISSLLSLFPSGSSSGSSSGSGFGSESGVSSARSALAFPFSFPLPLSSTPPSSPSTASQIPLSPTTSQQPPPLQIRALTYVDTQRITPSAPNPEYVTRMNRGIRDALSKGFPPSYVRDVMRVYIPAREEGDGF